MKSSLFNSLNKKIVHILFTLVVILFISCSAEVTEELPDVEGSMDMDSTDEVDSEPDNPPVVIAGEWTSISDTKLQDLNPCPNNDCDYSANLGFSSIIDAWCGGVFDTVGNRILIWGGGHLGYFGNDMYAFDLDTSMWSQVMAPSNYSALTSYESSGQYPDGRPLARHTYGNMAFIASENTFLATGAYGISPSGNGDNRFWAVDLNAPNLEWAEKTASESVGSMTASYAAYNDVDKMVYYHKASSGRFYKYDIKTDTHTYLTQKAVQIYAAAAMDTKRNKLLVLGGSSGDQAFVWDLNSSEPSNEDLTNNSVFQNSSGSELSNDSQFGLSYDVLNDKFVAWKGGKTVYVINPETYEVTKIVPSGEVNPGDPVSNGTYGRFRYAPSIEAFILVNGIDQDVFIFKL
ncbi:hypothetical protein [uncultured Croceitalea sp.]|uniref:hypothetical protein n=1 Tax=uncultured Croceitalea sp. TaxID=1798908 RepID=UPI0033064F89